MKKNRKKANTYRFNGHPYLHSGSIHSVEMAELESRVKQFEAKLADSDDPDDKKVDSPLAGQVSERTRQEAGRAQSQAAREAPEA
jgi:hypothetical protein